MTTLREAAQQALEALTAHADLHGTMYLKMDAITALKAALAESERDWSMLEATQEALREHMAEIRRLRAALAEPVQEPVAWTQPSCPGEYLSMDKDEYHTVPLYTAPPQRKPLTQEEIAKMFEEVVCALPPYPSVTEEMPERFTRAIERAHGIGGEP